MHEDDRDSTEEAMKALYSTPNTAYIEQRAFTRDGWKWLSWSDTAVLDEDGQIIEIIGVGRDITERKKIEQELIASKIKAEESDKLKTAFLNNLSHELRTPLNAILGFSGLVTNEKLHKEERIRFNEIINRSGTQLLSLIDDILDMASIEAGEVKVSLKQTDLNRIMEHICAQLRFEAEQNKVDLSFNPMPPDAAKTVTDETKLVQILTNLAGNAIKFSREGQVSIGCQSRHGEYLFLITDTGVGIPPEAQERIFERFMQADETIPGQFGGTGLGLSISKSYVELLGGRIWVESEQGKGSTFFFTLPNNS